MSVRRNQISINLVNTGILFKKPMGFELFS